jgi:hypothetical protein
MAKRALCIGINNYPGTQMDLAGCVNDANDWAAELVMRGYAVTKLLDAQATRQAMIAAFQALIGGAASGDALVITFSGHGTYVPDRSRDESDRLDEALCPHDVQTGDGPLVDDDIHALFAARQHGVRLLLISDSCHSGTVTRDVSPESDELPRKRFLPMGNWMGADRLARASARLADRVRACSSGSAFTKVLARTEDDLLLSGCKEGPNNFSYDARIKGRPNGAFTYFALKTLKTLPSDASYAQWHAAIHPTFLPSSSYPQSPQIVGSDAAKARKVFA